MAADVATARRVERPSWINLRTVLGLLLFTVALAGGHRILATSKTTVDVLMAARDLPQDTVMTPSDVRPVAVKMPGDVLAGYVLAGDSVDGAVLTRPVHEGELLTRGWIAPSAEPGAGRALTIPVEPEHAVGGELRPGDRVDVLATFDAGDVRARTTVLARAVDVLEVVRTGSITFGDDAVAGITVSVSREEAARLAFAVRTADIDISRVDGSAGPGGPSTVTREDLP